MHSLDDFYSRSVFTESNTLMATVEADTLV